MSLLLTLFGFPFLYVLLIYLGSPKKSISLKDGLKAIVMGLVSTVFLHFIYAIFPPESFATMSTFQKYFYQVAFREELSKFIAFWLLIKCTLKEQKHPLSYMFLCAMVGLGFAIEENLIYKYQYGMEVLKIRNFTSTFAHMFFGAFAGYWYGLGIQSFKSKKITNLKKWFKNYPKIYQSFYVFFGLLTGIVYHGLWNYNLATSAFAAEAIMIFMIIVGFVTCISMAKDLIKQYKENEEL